jgi:hypothetical protein
MAMIRGTYFYTFGFCLKSTLLAQFEKGEELKKRILENFEKL